MGQKKLEKVMEEEDLRMNRNDARDQHMLGRKQSFFVWREQDLNWKILSP